ncbi:hypothetical protein OPKNFCMD_0557 [Methylobacterium crusticola]|uniref:Uncharacterized protein n=1 Tax=Methylobacterium crusticola TaxID=1697972 RepID=A0ABQ4QSU1_9HYPH|nr:hypothetical protein [Methylobacterium crusticola]GJD47845.1 hypothetical protein OPKNFCMD_0557 [Methylobacterium crusticola]
MSPLPTRTPSPRLALAALPLAILLAGPAGARDRPPAPSAMSGDVDATGTVTPADPVLIPEADGARARGGRARGPEGPARADRNRRDVTGPARELVPD